MPLLVRQGDATVEPRYGVPHTIKLAHLLIEAVGRGLRTTESSRRCILVWHQSAKSARTVISPAVLSPLIDNHAFCAGPSIVNKTQCACGLGQEVFVLVIDEGNDGSLGGQARAMSCVKAVRAVSEKDCWVGKVVCVWRTWFVKSRSRLESFGDIC